MKKAFTISHLITTPPNRLNEHILDFRNIFLKSKKKKKKKAHIIFIYVGISAFWKDRFKLDHTFLLLLNNYI